MIGATIILLLLSTRHHTEKNLSRQFPEGTRDPLIQCCEASCVRRINILLLVDEYNALNNFCMMNLGMMYLMQVFFHFLSHTITSVQGMCDAVALVFPITTHLKHVLLVNEQGHRGMSDHEPDIHVHEKDVCCQSAEEKKFWL